MRRREVIGLIASAFVAPHVAFAQAQMKIARVGFLGPAPAANYASRVEALRAGLRELGYVEGTNLNFALRWADAANQMPELAAELVRAGWRSSWPLPRRKQRPSWRPPRQSLSFSQLMPILLASAMWPASRGPAAMPPD